MMRWNGFFPSLLFGLVAAVLYTPGVTLLRPLFGYGLATSLFVIAIASIYAFGLGSSPRRGLLAAVLVAGASSTGAILLAGSGAVAMVALMSLAVVRVTVLEPGGGPRAVAIECLIFFASLALGAFVLGRGGASSSLAIWAVFLVQSTYYLLASLPQRTRHGGVSDPFSAATRRARVLLEG